jgi:hypothetical protein
MRTTRLCPHAVELSRRNVNIEQRNKPVETMVEPTNEANEDHIRHRAYMLWLEEGQPEGRADDHWHQATSDARTKKEVATAVTVSKGKAK